MLNAFLKTRPLVFWPPAALLLIALGASLLDFEGTLAAATAATNWILNWLGWAVSWTSLGAVAIVVAAFFSPLGRVRIGGPEARPILPRWNWFSITLCTTIATGILFWGAAEPIRHLNGPPGFAMAEPNTPEAARFALASLFMHWTVTPYAIYAVPGLAFALAHFNLRAPYSYSGPLGLAYGGWFKGSGGSIVDSLALLALVAGVAASLGLGVLTLSGGALAVSGAEFGPLGKLVVTLSIVAVFVMSSVSGLQRGVRLLSDINVRLFFALAAFVLIAGPTEAMLRLGGEGLVDYGGSFFARSLQTGRGPDAEWVRNWPLFDFANWMAWAPITAMFIGRISVGYTVREFILFTAVAPAVFSVVWMTIFGGAALSLDLANGGSLSAAIASGGPEAVIYALFRELPLGGLVTAVFLVTVFISFVTAMDSNTLAMTDVSFGTAPPGVRDDAVQDPSQMARETAIKIFWGAVIGAVAWVMIATNGVAGVRMLSNLGGVPGLFIIVGCGVFLMRAMIAGPTREALYS